MASIEKEFKKVWCGLCEDCKPVKFSRMEADGLNDHAAVDIQCAECHFVIATLHAETV